MVLTDIEVTFSFIKLSSKLQSENEFANIL